MIRKQTIYTQTIGEGTEKEVRMITAEEGIDEVSDIFSGHALIGMQTPQGTMEHPIRFPIREAMDIVDAFTKFEDARAEEAPKEAKLIVDAMREQFEEQRNKIVVPGKG